MRRKPGDKVIRRESFESLHEVRVPEEEEEGKDKKAKKKSKKDEEEDGDLGDDVADVAVTGPVPDRWGEVAVAVTQMSRAMTDFSEKQTLESGRERDR